MAPTRPSSDGVPLLYSCIAYKSTILAEHASPSAGSHASSLATAVLPKISHKTDQKLTYTHGPDLVHYIASADSESRKSGSKDVKAGDGVNDRDRGLTYLVVAHASLGRRIPFNYLAEIRRRFLDVFGGEHPPINKNGKFNKQNTETQNTQDFFSTLPSYGAASFNTTLRNLTTTYNSSNSNSSAAASAAAAGDADGNYKPDALATARAELSDARVVMTDNIERVLDRGERIDLLVNQTDRLGGSARDFRVRSRDLRRQMWWKNVKLMVLVSVVMICLVYLLIGMGCGLPGWSKCVVH